MNAGKNESQKPTENIVKSTLIQAYSYDANTKALSVTFRDGTEIDYSDVPPDVVSRVFVGGGSVGSRFVKAIAKRFKFVKTG